jgi:uncharacterized membrane protein
MKKQKGTSSMAELIAVAYPDERRAEVVMEALKRLDHDDDLIDFKDVVALEKDADGKIGVKGPKSQTAVGAASGLALGALVGLVLFAPIAGAIFGAAAGALSGRLYGLQQIDDFVLEVREHMPPGSSVLLLLVNRAEPERILAELGKHGGKVIHTSLPDDAEARLRAALTSGGASAE